MQIDAYLNLFRGSAILFVHQLEREAVESLREILRPHPANLLEPLVLGPPVDGQFEDALLDVDKADLFKHLFEHGAQDGRAIISLGGDSHLVEPCAHGAVGVHRAVVAAKHGLYLLAFEPAAGLQRLKGLLGNLCLEIAPAAGRKPGVYIIKLFRVTPGISPAIATLVSGPNGYSASVDHVRIFDVEANIRRDHVGLDRRQIRANDP